MEADLVNILRGLSWTCGGNTRCHSNMQYALPAAATNSSTYVTAIVLMRASLSVVLAVLFFAKIFPGWFYGKLCVIL